MSSIPMKVQLDVYRKCAWMCRMPACLCPYGRHIDAWLPPDDDWASTIDHIIPKSLGGTNAFTNLRAAHRKCNAERGNGRQVPAVAS